jgi:small-conductance mechanosensitive channel
MMTFLRKFFEEPTLISIRNILLIVVIGYLAILTLNLIIRRLLWRNLSQQTKFIIGRLILYSGNVIIIILVLGQLQIKLAAVLGAAGVLGIVLGIASQTSIGNITSGLFLISEKTFEIGDLIRVGDKLGTVYSFDLLSVKLKTLDNLLVRIPNQTLISTEVTNITRFPIRRMDIEIDVAYKEDLRKVMEILKHLALENHHCLDEPEPLILIKDFTGSSIKITLGLWFEKTNYVNLHNSIMQEIKSRFELEEIEMPFPHLTLYTGEATKPFPVEVKQKQKNK